MKETSTWVSAFLAVIWFSSLLYMENTSLIESSGYPIKTGILEMFALVFWTRVFLWVNSKQREILLRE